MSKDIPISEAKKHLAAAERSIVEVLDNFRDKTHLSISAVELQTNNLMDGRETYSVKLEVKLS